jgi:beta-galactosidase
VQYRKVQYQKGVLIAVARRKGKEVARDTLATSAKADKMVLNPNVATIKSDACDLAYIQIEIRDKNGLIVPAAEAILVVR